MTAPLVWIEEGCIACGLCAHYCPDVFALCEESRIRAEVREDGVLDGNLYRKSALKRDIVVRCGEDLEAVVSDCPVQVVRYIAA
jgi:Fe-S-cluster-containing hydrogenase component 2